MTLKEQYWKDGYIFQFREGDMRMVLGDRLIDSHGYIPECLMSDELVNTDNVLGDCVVAIYKPNTNAICLGDLVNGKELVWQKSVYLMTLDEVKDKLGIAENEKLIIIKKKG